LKFDEYGLLLSETSPAPGCYGDSMAETARWINLKTAIGESVDIKRLSCFVTPTGYVRHPLSPWREDDMVSDQLMPFYLATKYDMRADLRDSVRAAGWRTGNGDLISPLFYTILRDNPFGAFLALLAQLAIFKIPFRWSDSKKRFESNADSSADYLNWIQGLLWLQARAPKLARFVADRTSFTHLVERVSHYYRDEPNWKGPTLLYFDVIAKLYT
jgi:hypothetical protein